ncbi:hemolysin III family protein, partial [Salmonella enterica subsp. enterica serovar Senftenberg]|nr:hemolysin III family protein [Salmonella enterica subsp. enterica serovar Senftenberg]
VLKRMDHSNIFLIIAGTYTPFALLLPPAQARTMLLIVWIGAVAGVLFRVFWVGAPRWLYTPVYVALGWVAVFYLGPLLHFGGPAIVTLIAVGGLLYTAGALVYGIKRPNPSPRWFGFHEIFHALTVAAFVTHYVAASLTVYGAAS